MKASDPVVSFFLLTFPLRDGKGVGKQVCPYIVKSDVSLLDEWDNRNIAIVEEALVCMPWRRVFVPEMLSVLPVKSADPAGRILTLFDKHIKNVWTPENMAAATSVFLSYKDVVDVTHIEQAKPGFLVNAVEDVVYYDKSDQSRAHNKSIGETLEMNTKNQLFKGKLLYSPVRTD